MFFFAEVINHRRMWRDETDSCAILCQMEESLSHYSNSLFGRNHVTREFRAVVFPLCQLTDYCSKNTDSSLVCSPEVWILFLSLASFPYQEIGNVTSLHHFFSNLSNVLTDRKRGFVILTCVQRWSFPWVSRKYRSRNVHSSTLCQKHEEVDSWISGVSTT